MGELWCAVGGGVLPPASNRRTLYVGRLNRKARLGRGNCASRHLSQVVLEGKGQLSMQMAASFEPSPRIWGWFECLSVTMFLASSAFSENIFGLRAVHSPLGLHGRCVR